MSVLLILYFVLGYWAAGRTIYANKIIVTSAPFGFSFSKFMCGMFLGWILIPIAIIKKIAGK